MNLPYGHWGEATLPKVRDRFLTLSRRLNSSCRRAKPRRRDIVIGGMYRSGVIAGGAQSFIVINRGSDIP
jgi:hypothetical protein